MNVSNALFQIAGFFERCAETGGTVTAIESRFLASQLGALAEAANAQAIAAKAISDEFDAYIEAQGAPAPSRKMRAFSVVEGGREG